ncbi:MAG TPA: DUF2147 domain-containing protein [Beijerinckiaceae bacterium]|nr:DUF2147 domain-containing protein [Beijerinckiaceae bacterium]
MLRLALGFAALIALPSAASAQSLIGTWTRDSGASKVTFAKCGEAVCGTLSWLKDTSGKAKVGQRVFSNLKETAPGKYSGTAIDPEDGKQYNGTITVTGNTMKGGGCVLGGMICRTVVYNRGG